MLEPENPIRFFTFYSYKGGVGRTMAVANVACQLANRHGHHVVCVDWDLEAPGLHYYFGYKDEELAGRDGLLDYLLEFKWQLSQGAKGAIPEVKNYLQDISEKHPGKIRFGSVRLMHCGRTDADYMARVQDFDWGDFYEKHEGFRVVETLKQQLLHDAKADVVLVDARAGQTEVGATPTIQMPDAVVMLFTSNTQSLEGAERICRQLHKHPLRKQLGRAPAFLLVPARVFPREESFQRWLDGQAAPIFERLVAAGVISRQNQPRGLEQCILSIDPKWAVGERLPILEVSAETGVQQAPELNRAYSDLAQAVSNLDRATPAWELTASIPLLGPRLERENLLEEISAASGRGDDEAVAFLQLRLGRHDIETQRPADAFSPLQSALAFYQRTDNQELIAASSFLLGRARLKQGEFDEARPLLERALEVLEQTGDARSQGVTLYAMSRAHTEQSQFDQAWPLLERALALLEKAGDTPHQGVVLHEMGRARLEQTRFDDAWLLLERALTLKKLANDARGQGVTLHEMGRVRLKQGRFDEAWSLLERALALKKQAGDAWDQGVTLYEMARVRKEQQRFDECKGLLERALRCAEEAGDDEGAELARKDLARLQALMLTGQ